MLICFLSSRRGFREVRHQRLGHVGETGDMRTHVAGRVGVNDVLAFRNFAFRLRFADDLDHVVADGLRKAGGVDGDNIRVIDGEHGLELPAADWPGRRRRTSLR